MKDRMKKRMNKGYVIKKATRVGRTEVVFGVNPTEPLPYVTWRTNEWGNFRDYYWGHYFKDEKEALKDYEARITELQCDLKKEKKPNRGRGR